MKRRGEGSALACAFLFKGEARLWAWSCNWKRPLTEAGGWRMGGTSSKRKGAAWPNHERSAAS